MENHKPKIINKITKLFRKLRWQLRTLSRNKPFIVSLFAIFLVMIASGKHKDTRAPTITVVTPVEKSLISDKQLFVRGKVWPGDAEITVNGIQVAKNGNGEFTAVIDVPVGKSILKFSSNLNGKKSSMIMPVERKRGPEEELAYQQQRARDQALSDQKVAGLRDEVINKVNKLQDVQSMIKITSQQVATIGAQRKVTGTLFNSGTANAFGVTAIVTFYDTAHSIVDIQQVKIVNGSTPMSAGQSLPFATQLTTKIFSTFEIAVTASVQPTTSNDDTGMGFSPTSAVNPDYQNPVNPNN